MTVVNSDVGSTIDEIAAGVFRISIPMPPSVVPIPGGFSFNQYLIVDDQPLLYHTGPRRLFSLVREAVEKVLPASRLAFVALSHVEADECGGLNEFLAAAPTATPVCSQVAAMVSVNDLADRPARPLADGEVLALGRHRLRWFDTPHMPHAWDCGMAFDETTGTLLCGDLFTQPGHANPPLTRGDILGSSEAMRGMMDYFAHCPDTRRLLTRLAATAPTTLACMHGSAWQGDGAALLLALADRLESAPMPR